MTLRGVLTLSSGAYPIPDVSIGCWRRWRRSDVYAVSFGEKRETVFLGRGFWAGGYCRDRHHYYSYDYDSALADRPATRDEDPT